MTAKIKTETALNYTTFAEVRSHYERDRRFEPARLFSLSQYRQMSLPAAIRQAADTKDLTFDGPKKDRHKRYSWLTLNACRDALLADQRRLRTSAKAGFDRLLPTVGEVLDDAGLMKVRELGRYDFAIKIGAVLGCEPTDRVYVHRKPLRIARILGLPIVRGEGHPHVLRSAFHPDLASMRADSLENLLCVCGDELVRVAHRVGRLG